MPVQCYTDETGLLRSSAPGHEGDLLDMAASAYDTCVNLGQDPLYATDTMLPAKVVAYYEPFGTSVLEYAALGWMRGRGFTMRDPWRVLPATDRGRKAPRRVPGKRTIVTTDPSVAGPETWFSETAATRSPARPKEHLGYAVKIDVDSVVLTPAVIADLLHKDTKLLLKRHLVRQDWQPREMGDGTLECRTVGQVKRICRLMSNSLSGPWTEIPERLTKDLQWQRPTKPTAFTAADL